MKAALSIHLVMRNTNGNYSSNGCSDIAASTIFPLWISTTFGLHILDAIQVFFRAGSIRNVVDDEYSAVLWALGQAGIKIKSIPQSWQGHLTKSELIASLLRAYEHGPECTFKMLTDLDWDIGSADISVPLFVDFKRGKGEILDAILSQENGILLPPIDWISKLDPPPLHICARFGHSGAIRRLLESSLSPQLRNRRDIQGRTALHYALKAGQVDAASVLLDYRIFTTPTQIALNPTP
ncbi:hypothetical protein B0T17DRAFT_234134 [Bombardia bombarda]|uniref:Ankyrin n=1 Tax=Bombardia bombarda TaxID=252184 RepID=A0AA39XBI1_9PEZI|nr:hypothetical protein B0T17DRAFT_234134 [Bombardia bombarda]